MEIEAVRDESVATIRLTGEIDLLGAPAIRNRLRELMEQGARRMIVNMASVPYIDSSGIGAFLGARKELVANGGRLIFVELTESVNRVFELTKLKSFFEFYASEDEARAAHSAAAAS